MDTDNANPQIPSAACRAAVAVSPSVANGRKARSQSAPPVGWHTTLPIGSRGPVGFFFLPLRLDRGEPDATLAHRMGESGGEGFG